MEVCATLQERTSKKSGNKYYCVVIKLTDNLEKIVYLDQAELELCKIYYSL